MSNTNSKYPKPLEYFGKPISISLDKKRTIVTSSKDKRIYVLEMQKSWIISDILIPTENNLVAWGDLAVLSGNGNVIAVNGVLESFHSFITLYVSDGIGWLETYTVKLPKGATIKNICLCKTGKTFSVTLAYLPDRTSVFTYVRENDIWRNEYTYSKGISCSRALLSVDGTLLVTQTRDNSIQLYELGKTVWVYLTEVLPSMENKEDYSFGKNLALSNCNRLLAIEESYIDSTDNKRTVVIHLYEFILSELVYLGVIPIITEGEITHLTGMLVENERLAISLICKTKDSDYCPVIRVYKREVDNWSLVHEQSKYIEDLDKVNFAVVYSLNGVLL